MVWCSIIRVAIADDHPEMRVALRLLLELSKELEVVGEASNGPEGLDCVHHPRDFDFHLHRKFLYQLGTVRRCQGLHAERQACHRPEASN
jgi:hypothetical protein